MPIDYGLFDVDNPHYESEEAFTRHLDLENRGHFSAAFPLFGEEKHFGEAGDRKPGEEEWVLRPGSKRGSSQPASGRPGALPGKRPRLPGLPYLT